MVSALIVTVKVADVEPAGMVTLLCANGTKSALVAVPDVAAFPRPTGRQSTQVAFGKILNDIARAGGPLADAIVTTSPDVTVSTNLGGWVNQRGLFARDVRRDQFKDSNIASPQRWMMGPTGQHIELGIAENNLFLLLGALGFVRPESDPDRHPLRPLHQPRP